MDSYLEIAKRVLKEARQPLSARQILKSAYQLQIVPRDLYGRTQHKTLQARLSTDILKRRTRSDFYRTGPGKFFLRILLHDGSIPARHRREYLAPLRAAQLGRFDVLGFSRAEIRRLAIGGALRIRELFSLKWRYYRMDEIRRDAAIVPFRFLLLVVDDQRILLNVHRPSNEGDFSHRSTLGLPGIVKREDRCLFSTDEIGFPDAALRTLIEHFDLPGSAIAAVEEPWRWSHAHLLFDERDKPAVDDLMAIISFKCSGVVEVTSAVDALSSMEWLRLPIQANDLDRFDRWSSQIVGDAALQAEVCG